VGGPPDAGWKAKHEGLGENFGRKSIDRIVYVRAVQIRHQTQSILLIVYGAEESGNDRGVGK
jgi:hypothetical protein